MARHCCLCGGVGGGGPEIERENKRVTARERKIGVETRIEGMGDTAGEGGTKKGVWHRNAQS